MLEIAQETTNECLTSFEQELILSFQKHHATGNRWYPIELREKIFLAYEHGLRPSQVI